MLQSQPTNMIFFFVVLSILVLFIPLFWLLYKITNQKSLVEGLESQETVDESNQNDYEAKKIALQLIDEWSKIETQQHILNDLEGHKRKMLTFFVINFFEKLSIAINYGLADNKMLYEYFGLTLVSCYKQFESFILKERKENQNYHLFKNFELVANKWYEFNGK